MRLRIVLNLAGWFWNRPVGRLEYWLPAILYLMLWQNAAKADREPVIVVLAATTTVLLILRATGRMLDLGIDRQWALPHALLLLGFPAAFVLASEPRKLIVMAAYALTQAPLLLLSSRLAPPASDS